MQKTNNRKIDNFKMYYWHDAVLVGKYHLPQLQPTQSIPCNVISFNERNGIKNPQNHWVDFFIDDFNFEGFWNRPEKSLENLRKFKGVIATDYSMYPELLPGQNIWNCTRNRVMTYYMQSKGLDAIPVASWLDEDFDWCFDGLPEESSIAISTNGCLSNPYSNRVFLKGVEILQATKHPTHLIVCGRPIDELDKYDNVIYYPCFSERWEEREKNGK